MGVNKGVFLGRKLRSPFLFNDLLIFKGDILTPQSSTVIISSLQSTRGFFLTILAIFLSNLGPISRTSAIGSSFDSVGPLELRYIGLYGRFGHVFQCFCFSIVESRHHLIKKSLFQIRRQVIIGRHDEMSKLFSDEDFR